MSHGPILRRYAVLAAMDIGAKGLGFLATIAVVKHWHATGFGELSFAQSIVIYGLMAATCGMDLYAVKNVAALRDRLGAAVTTVMGLRLLLGVGIYAVLLGLAALVPVLRPILGLVALYGLTLFTAALSLLWVPQAIQRTHVLGLAQLVIQATYFGLVLGAIRLDLGDWSVPVALVAAEGAVALGLLVWMRRHVARFERPWPRKKAFAFLREAAPIGGSQILRALALGSDIVLVGLFMSLDEVGWYSGAHKLFLIGVSLVAVYFVILFPQFARRYGEETEALLHEVHHSLWRVLPAGVVGVVGAWFLADWVLELFYDPTFHHAVSPLRILLLALVIHGVAAHYRNALIASGRQRSDLRNVAVSSTVHVASKIGFLPWLGIEGAAVGTLLGEGILLGLGWRSLRVGTRPAVARRGSAAADNLVEMERDA